MSSSDSDGDGDGDDDDDDDGSEVEVMQLPSFSTVSLKKVSSSSKRAMLATTGGGGSGGQHDVDVLPPTERPSLRKNPSHKSMTQSQSQRGEGSQMTFRDSMDSEFDLDELPSTLPSLSKSISKRRSVVNTSDPSYTRQVSFINPFSKTSATARQITIYTVQGLTVAFLLDILAVIALSVALGARVGFVRHCRDVHNFILNHEGRWNAALESIIKDFMMLRTEVRTIKLTITVCVLLGVMQLFSHLSYSRRLGIITGTIGRSLHDLVPVIIIFITLLVAYAILGTNIYGDRLAEWSNIYTSMITLFIMILGEYGIYDDSKYTVTITNYSVFLLYITIAHVV
jgi:hypothetical protein